jgi:phosphoglycerate dehydrogenase-like enzyme
MNIAIALPDDAFRRTFFTAELIGELRQFADIQWNESEAPWTPEQMKEALQKADIVFNGMFTPMIVKEMLAESPLKLICNMGALKRSISRDLFTTGILISSDSNAFVKPVAEMTLMLLLMSFRKAYDLVYRMKMNSFDLKRDRMPAGSLYGRTIGIFGYGSIARQFVRLLKPFEPDIIVCDPYCSEEEGKRNGFRLLPIEQFLPVCDAVCVHHSLTESTYHLLNEANLRKLKTGAIIVNTARGAILDERALIEELQQGRLFAALDVYEQEPPPADSPLRSLPNVILTPHVAGFTFTGREELFETAVREAVRYMRGETPLHLINVNQYDRTTDMSILSRR